MECNSCSNGMTQVYGQLHFYCQSCDSFEFTPESLAIEPIESLEKKTPFACPRCQHELGVGLLAEHTQICFCERCRGFVIDSRSLGSLVKHLRDHYKGPDDKPTPIDPSEMDRREHCPACKEMMDAHPYYGPGSVVIDTCMHCQLVWLDHGELGRIIRAPGVRNKTKSGNLESKKLRAELNNRFYDKSNPAYIRRRFGL